MATKCYVVIKDDGVYTAAPVAVYLDKRRAIDHMMEDEESLCTMNVFECEFNELFHESKEDQ